AATTEESTPPDIATTIRAPFRGFSSWKSAFIAVPDRRSCTPCPPFQGHRPVAKSFRRPTRGIHRGNALPALHPIPVGLAVMDDSFQLRARRMLGPRQPAPLDYDILSAALIAQQAKSPAARAQGRFERAAAAKAEPELLTETVLAGPEWP